MFYISGQFDGQACQLEFLFTEINFNLEGSFTSAVSLIIHTESSHKD
jgi:hypothetical protein